MSLVLTVALIVLVVIMLIAIAGTLIENAEEKLEHSEPAARNRHDRA
jgi:Tfp pilus assembly protein PilX